MYPPQKHKMYPRRVHNMPPRRVHKMYPPPRIFPIFYYNRVYRVTERAYARVCARVRKEKL